MNPDAIAILAYHFAMYRREAPDVVARYSDEAIEDGIRLLEEHRSELEANIRGLREELASRRRGSITATLAELSRRDRRN